MHIYTPCRSVAGPQSGCSLEYDKRFKAVYTMMWPLASSSNIYSMIKGFKLCAIMFFGFLIESYFLAKLKLADIMYIVILCH